MVPVLTELHSKLAAEFITIQIRSNLNRRTLYELVERITIH
jgi:hypothetical protein